MLANDEDDFRAPRATLTFSSKKTGQRRPRDRRAPPSDPHQAPARSVLSFNTLSTNRSHLSSARAPRRAATASASAGSIGENEIGETGAGRSRHGLPLSSSAMPEDSVDVVEVEMEEVVGHKKHARGGADLSGKMDAPEQKRPKPRRNEEDVYVDPLGPAELTEEMEQFLKQHLKPDEKVIWKERRTNRRALELMLQLLIPVGLFILPAIIVMGVAGSEKTTNALLVLSFGLTLWFAAVWYGKIQVVRNTFYVLTTRRTMHCVGPWPGLCENNDPTITLAVRLSKVLEGDILLTHSENGLLDGSKGLLYFREGGLMSGILRGFEGIRDPEELLGTLTKQVRKKHRRKSHRPRRHDEDIAPPEMSELE